MIKLQNNGRTTLVHDVYRLEPQGILEVPEKVAKRWLHIEGVVEYVAPIDLKAQKEAYEAEIAQLKAELAKAKEAKAKEAKAAKKK